MTWQVSLSAVCWDHQFTVAFNLVTCLLRIAILFLFNIVSFLSESVSATRISSNSVQLSWTKPSDFKGVTFRYHLEYRPRQLLIGDENTTEVIIQSNQISYVIDGLDPFTLYDIKMTAVTNQGIDTIQLFVYPGQQTLSVILKLPYTVGCIF